MYMLGEDEEDSKEMVLDVEEAGSRKFNARIFEDLSLAQTHLSTTV